MSNIKAQFLNRTAIGLLVAAAVALALAYQTRAPIILEMGSASEDVYLARGFYPPENAFGVSYRWTSGNAQIQLPGLGSGIPFHLRVSLHEFRPPPLAPNPVIVSLNGHTAERFTPGMDLAAYEVDLPAAAMDLRGGATIGLKSDTFVPKQTMGTNDERALGLFVDQFGLEYGRGVIWPPVIVWALLVIAVLSAYAFGRVIGLSSPFSLIAGLAVLVGEIAGVVMARLWLGHNSPWLALAVASLYLVALRLKQGTSVANVPAPAALSTQRTALALITAVFIIWRVMLVIVPLVGADVVSVNECCPQIDASPVASIWQAATERWYRWDALWYGSIAQNGYQYFRDRATSNVAFFPLFPALMGLVSRVTTLPMAASGPLVSTLLAWAACLALYRLTLRETGSLDTATRSVAYMLAFPMAYYMGIGYTEALYVLCVVAAFLWAREGRWLLSGAAAFLAGLTRMHGALLIVPLAYEYLRQHKWRLRNWRANALGVLGGPLGVLAYTGYCAVQFGQPLAFLQVQMMFFRGVRGQVFPAFPGDTLATYIEGMVSNAPSTERIIETSAMILMLLLTLEAWGRLPRVYGMYMLTFSLFSLVSGDLQSLPRYLLPTFPGFMALALMGQRPWVDHAILIASLSMQSILALMFTHGYWVA